MDLQADGPILSKVEFQQFHGKAVRAHCVHVCHCLHRCGNLLSGLNPEGARDGLLQELLWDVGI